MNNVVLKGTLGAGFNDDRYTLPKDGNAGDILVRTETGSAWEKQEPATTTPDWNQNDETASDYIKNRPGGYDVPMVLDLWYDGWWYNTPNEHSLVFDISDEADVTPGRAVSVTIGDVEHQTELRLFDADSGKFYVGNMALSEKFNGPGGDDTGETFCVCFELEADGDTWYISTIDANVTDIGETGTKLNTPLILTPEHKMIPQEYLCSVGRVYTVNGEKRGEIFNWLPEDGTVGMPTASGNRSHAEGYDTTASEYCSHAEGSGTTASGWLSHTEGSSTTASGYCSHAEGSGTTASGKYSHAEGSGTTASGEDSHVQGKFNIEDTAQKYAHIVGNGKNVYSRSNAHTLDWSGNAWYAGTVEGTAMIVKSSTSGSTKKFSITVDDAGTISATEVT